MKKKGKDSSNSFDDTVSIGSFGRRRDSDIPERKRQVGGVDFRGQLIRITVIGGVDDGKFYDFPCSVFGIIVGNRLFHDVCIPVTLDPDEPTLSLSVSTSKEGIVFFNMGDISVKIIDEEAVEFECKKDSVVSVVGNTALVNIIKGLSVRVTKMSSDGEIVDTDPISSNSARAVFEEDTKMANQFVRVESVVLSGKMTGVKAEKTANVFPLSFVISKSGEADLSMSASAVDKDTRVVLTVFPRKTIVYNSGSNPIRVLDIKGIHSEVKPQGDLTETFGSFVIVLSDFCSVSFDRIRDANDLVEEDDNFMEGD